MNNEKLLRTTLFVNAGFSTLSAFDFIFFDRFLTDLIVKDIAFSLIPIGVSLLLFAAFVAFTATRQKINRWFVWTIVAMDLGWVLGSIALVGFATVTTFIGNVLILGVAAIIGVFAVLQAKGLTGIPKEA